MASQRAAAEPTSADPLAVFLKQLGFPSALVLAAALLWGLFTNADKLERVVGWIRDIFKPKNASSTLNQSKVGSPEQTRQIARDNSGPVIQGGDNSTIMVTITRDLPAADHDSKGSQQSLSLDFNDRHQSTSPAKRSLHSERVSQNLEASSLFIMGRHPLFFLLLICMLIANFNGLLDVFIIIDALSARGSVTPLILYYRILGHLYLLYLIYELIRWKKWAFSAMCWFTALNFLLNGMAGTRIIPSLLGISMPFVVYISLQLGGKRKGWARLK